MYLLNSMRNSVLFWFFSGGFRSLQYILADRQTDGRTDVIPSTLNHPGHVRQKGNTKAVSPRRDEGIAVLIKLVCQQALRDWWREQRVRSPQGSKATWTRHSMQMTRCFSAEMLNI